MDDYLGGKNSVSTLANSINGVSVESIISKKNSVPSDEPLEVWMKERDETIKKRE